MAIRVIIVDDEPIARRGLRNLLKHEKDMEIIAECGDGMEAAQQIVAQHPDIVFLDIQMPELDGFGVVEAVGPEHLPLVIFVTAYDEYALKAFRVHAVDYLLKPVKPDQFREALDHVRTVLESKKRAPFEKSIRNVLEDITPRRRALDRFVIRSLRNITFVDARDVDWIEAYGDYVRLHVGQRKHVLRQTMSELEHSLEPSLFIRIHRSAIVQIGKIKEMVPQTNGDYSVLLHTGERLMLSRTYRARAFEALSMHS